MKEQDEEGKTLCVGHESADPGETDFLLFFFFFLSLSFVPATEASTSFASALATPFTFFDFFDISFSSSTTSAGVVAASSTFCSFSSIVVSPFVSFAALDFFDLLLFISVSLSASSTS